MLLVPQYVSHALSKSFVEFCPLCPAPSPSRLKLPQKQKRPTSLGFGKLILNGPQHLFYVLRKQ